MRLFINIVLLNVVTGFSVFSADTLGLQEAIQLGLENNYSIRIAENNAQIAENNNTLGNAGFLPQVALTAGKTNNISTTRQEYYTGVVREKNNAQSKSLTAGLMLNWTLFDGGAMFIEKSKFAELQQIGKLQYRMTVENTLAEILTTYFSIVQQQRNINMLKQTLEVSRQRLQIAMTKYKLGSASEMTYLQSKVDFNADSAAFIRQLTGLRNTKAELNKLLVRDIMIDFEVENNIPILPILSYDQLIKDMEVQNAGIMMAEHNKNVSHLNYRLSHAPLYPRINFFSGYNFARSESQVGLMQYSKSVGPVFGASMSYTLFDGFNQTRNIQNARLENTSAEINYESGTSEIKLLAYRIYNEYNTALQLISFEQENVELSKKNTFIAFERYKLGEMSDIDFRETQVKQMLAENRLLLTQFATKQYETELLRIAGRLIE